MERAGLEFHDRTRAAFQARAEADPDRWLVLDGAASREQIATQIRQRVEPLATERRGESGQTEEVGHLGEPTSSGEVTRSDEAAVSLGEVGHPGEPTSSEEVTRSDEVAASSGEYG